MSEALLARRKLGNELLRLREEADLTQGQIAKIIWSSATTVHRMEQGRSQIKGPQIETLLRALKIEDRKLEEQLLHLAGLSQDGEQPYDKYRASLSTEALQFFGYEEVATHIRDLQIVFLPGLLQTADYAREVIQSVQGIRTDVEGFLLLREDRQRKIIHRENPPQLTFFIDEAVLYRPFGSAEIMAEQFQQLRQFARLPHVTIKIVPLSQGASPALRGSFTLLEFAEYPEVLFMEGPRGDVNVHEEEAIRARQEVWAAIEQQHVSHLELEHYIQKALDKG